MQENCKGIFVHALSKFLNGNFPSVEDTFYIELRRQKLQLLEKINLVAGSIGNRGRLSRSAMALLISAKNRLQSSSPPRDFNACPEKAATVSTAVAHAC